MAFEVISSKWFLIGLLSIIFGILSLIWTPFDLVMEERLRMRPGLPPLEWWKNPAGDALFKIYFFNITNADGFLGGKDPRIKVEEVGPIVFKFVIRNTDLVFNENSTLSYTLIVVPVYQAEQTQVDLNATLFVPNLPMLLMVAHFWDANFFIKNVLNYFLKMLDSKLIVKKTFYELLYNNTDPFLSFAHRVAPSIAINDNLGLMPLIYNDKRRRITVFIGTKFGHQRFFLIDKFEGASHVPGRQGVCKDTITNSSCNFIYSQLVPKTRVVTYFDDRMCKSVRYVYEEEVYSQGLKAYRFRQEKDSYNRTEPLEDDCYKGNPPLPNGAIDISPCYFSYSVAASFPHFLYASEEMQKSVDGLKPNASKHSSYATVEPTTGVIVQIHATAQANIRIPPLRGFHKGYEKFSDMIMPLFYSQVTMDCIPSYASLAIRFILLLPVIGGVISSLLFIGGLLCLWKSKKRMLGKKCLFSENKEQVEEGREQQPFLEKNFI